MNFWKWLRSAVSDPDGTASHRKILTVLIFVIFSVGYLRKLAANLGGDCALPDVPENWAFIILGTLGIAGAVSVFRKGGTNADAETK